MTKNAKGAEQRDGISEAAVAMVAGLLLLLGIYGHFYARLYNSYLLVHDDPGNVGGTVAGGLWEWLTRGMAGYYHVYPEWPQPAFSNFYRPVWNLILYSEQAVFGSRYWAWFLAFCLLQYGGALLFLRVLRLTGTPTKPALFFSILFLFNPAFLNFGFIYPGFQFDVFASLLLIAACHQLLRYHYGLALALITAAVFTKETAIFAPVAASITVLFQKKDRAWSAAMLMPLLLWIGARELAFGAVMGGTFASPASFAEMLANIGGGLILWPSSAVPTGFPLHMTGLYGLALCLLLTMNGILWALLGHASWRTAHAFWRDPEDVRAQHQAILLVWALGALAYCMLIRPQARFGASFDAFLLLFLASFLFTRPWPAYVRVIPVAILAFVTLIRGVHLLGGDLEKERMERRGDRALFAGLRALPQDGRPVLIVNAPVMLSAPVFVVREWNLKLHVTFLNQFHGCPLVRGRDAGYRMLSMTLSIQIPPCASFVFAGVPEDIQAKARAGDLLRPGIGIYRFADRPGFDKRLDSGDIDFGRKLEVRLLHAPRTVLVYDWRTGAYVPLS